MIPERAWKSVSLYHTVSDAGPSANKIKSDVKLDHQLNYTNEFLLPVALFLLLPRETEIHTSIADYPDHNNSASYNGRIIRWVETFMSVQMIRLRTFGNELSPFVFCFVQSRCTRQ